MVLCRLQPTPRQTRTLVRGKSGILSFPAGFKPAFRKDLSISSAPNGKDGKSRLKPTKTEGWGECNHGLKSVSDKVSARSRQKQSFETVSEAPPRAVECNPFGGNHINETITFSMKKHAEGSFLKKGYFHLYYYFARFLNSLREFYFPATMWASWRRAEEGQQHATHFGHSGLRRGDMVAEFFLPLRRKVWRKQKAIIVKRQ